MGLLELHSTPSPTDLDGNVGTVLEAYGSSALLLHTALLTLIFAALKYYVAPRLLAFLPGGAPVSAKTTNVMTGYLVAVTHHLYVTPLALYSLWCLASTGTFPYSLLLTCPPLSLAYLLSDLLLYAIPLWDLEVIVHHVITLTMSFKIILSPVQLLRWAATLELCEASSILLAASYFCRKVKAWDGTPAHQAIESAFAAVFFLTRVLNLPLATANLLLRHTHDAASMGWPTALGLLALCGLQFYWFFKIVQKVCLKAPLPAEAQEQPQSRLAGAGATEHRAEGSKIKQ